MHKLMRRGAQAAAGAGLGVVAAMALAAAPSAAQTPTDPNAEPLHLFVHYENLKVDANTIAGSGYLEDQGTGDQMGFSHIRCAVTQATQDYLGALCDATHQLPDGDLYLTFHARYDTTSDSFLPSDGAVTGGTDAYLYSKGEMYLEKSAILVPGAESYLLQHWIDKSA